MVYHHRSVRCPNCNKVIERTVTVDSEMLLGSPFRRCPFCNADYFDSEYKEPAILAFENEGGKLNVAGIIWAIISNGAFFYLLYLAATENSFESLAIPLCIGAVLALLFDIGIVRMSKNRIHGNEFHQKQIDFIEGRTGNRTIGIAESMNRLGSREYLNALKSHGVDVPDYFYDRLKINSGSPVNYREIQASGNTENRNYNVANTRNSFDWKTNEKQKESGFISNEPENIRFLLKHFLEELNNSFPNRQIIWTEWNHDLWDSTANYLCRSLGYSSGKSFLEAYGFTIVTENSSSHLFCRKCGKKIPSDSVFCPFCGEKT